MQVIGNLGVLEVSEVTEVSEVLEPAAFSQTFNLKQVPKSR